MQRVQCYLPGASVNVFAILKAAAQQPALSQCLGPTLSHGAELIFTSKHVSLTEPFWMKLPEMDLAKCRGRVDWLARGISSKQTAVSAGGCSCEFGCRVGRDLVGGGELI